MSRAKLFKYLKYDKLTNKYCNEENASGNCVCCPVKIECDYNVNHDVPWLIEVYWFLKWLPYRISNAFSNYYVKHKKTHYECSICGQIEAPYFQDKVFLRESITGGYGWWKAKNGRSTRWVCHSCMEHGFSVPIDGEFVVRENEKMLAQIKEKDPEYYEKWFGDRK